jgi:hypothetical protein
MNRFTSLNLKALIKGLNTPTLKTCLVLVLTFLHISVKAQESKDPKLSLAFYEGVVVGGYVDKGFFMNFGGPNVNVSFKSSIILLGMFPSLRFKEDNGTPKNSFVTPGLGIGFTYMFKNLALQIPFYFNSKTAKENGKWNLGFGIGYKISGLNKK